MGLRAGGPPVTGVDQVASSPWELAGNLQSERGQGGGPITSGLLGGKEVPRRFRLGRRKLATETGSDPGVPPGPGWAGGSWLPISGAGRLWPLGGLGGFAPAPVALAFQLTLLPQNTGTIPREKEGARGGASAGLGELRHLTRKTTRLDKIPTQRIVLCRVNELGAFLERRKGSSLLLRLFFNKGKPEK